MISPASFNYYQDVIQEAEDIAYPEVAQAFETGSPAWLVDTILEYTSEIPLGFLTVDQD